jgi:hypothetical protein
MGRPTDNDDQRWFRSDRFFLSDGQWFFTTREQADFGPFVHYADAVKALRRYVETQATVKHVRRHLPEKGRDESFDIGSVGTLAEDLQKSGRRRQK